MNLQVPVRELPSELIGAQRPGPIHQVLGNEVLIELPGLARVLVRAGEVAGVQPEPGVGPEDVAWLLDGHVRHVAALQRGEFALRASAVVIDGRAVAICGHGATGSSAVAAGLARRGHAVLADGWLPVTTPDLLALACTHELALWADVARIVECDPADGQPVRPGLDKRRYRFARGENAPLGAVVILHRYDWEEETRAERVVGGTSLEQLLDFVAVGHLVVPLGLDRQRFLWAATVAAGCPVHLLELDRFQPGVDEPAQAVEELVGR